MYWLQCCVPRVQQSVVHLVLTAPNDTLQTMQHSLLPQRPLSAVGQALLGLLKEKELNATSNPVQRRLSHLN